MRLHILSDLHNEFVPFRPTVGDADVVILAGDIDIKGRGIPWAQASFSCPVIYVPGNHEFYQGHLERTLAKMQAAGNGQTGRVRVLDRTEVEIAGVRFLGTTGWTDYAATGNIYLAAAEAEGMMNDFRHIRTTEHFRKCRPSDLVARARANRAWLRERLAVPFAGPTVVITHHAPSPCSLGSSQEALPHLAAAYVNQWEDLMGPGVALWVHGHIHRGVDYAIGETRILSNPRGYPGEDTGFDPQLLVELA